MTIFVDSSVLVEYLKGNNDLFLKLLKARLAYARLRYAFNAAVLNEFLFYYLAVESKKAPLTIKRNKLIQSVLSGTGYKAVLRQVHYLPDHPTFAEKVPDLMALYNLLPSDAFILATCRHHHVRYLATLDTDFSIPCTAEAISIINDESTLREAVRQMLPD